jgi:hypothetical protein
MLNKYFNLTSKLEEENMLLPDFDMKTNNVINEVCKEVSPFLKMAVTFGKMIFTLTKRFAKNNL